MKKDFDGRLWKGFGRPRMHGSHARGEVFLGESYLCPEGVNVELSPALSSGIRF